MVSWQPTPVPGELRSLPTDCKDKTQRSKYTDSPQTSNIKHKFIKDVALVFL